MPAILFTGFPGFLGSALLPRVLEREETSEAICLVQPRFAALARDKVAALAAERPALRGRIRLLEGDITRPALGIADTVTLRGVEEIYHLAAVYDLEVSRELGMRVNVDGTRHVLDLAAGCPTLRRLHYVSTCYVSGRYAGIFGEDDFDCGQVFNNWYEETKYLAEREVRSRMVEGLPATIYRPAIVVGDSTTGETQKYDGPYVILRWLMCQPRVALLPMIGDPAMTRVNIVPRNFVVDALAHLSGLRSSRGRVYHLADPAPLTPDDIIREMGRATGRRIVRVPLPRRAAKAALRYVPGLNTAMGIPPNAVDYFAHQTHYTVTNTEADLAGTGVRVPPLASYLDTMVGFMARHPEIGAAAMV